MPSNASRSPSDILFEVAADVARASGYKVEENPGFLSQRVSRSQDIAGEVGIPVPARPPDFHLNTDRSLAIDCYSVLLAEFHSDCSQEKTQSEILRQQRRAGIALTWLHPSKRSDLNLFIVCPPGSCESPEWNDIAGQIERNEQVCRKIVWLPPCEPISWESSAISFCDRTFLARPWMMRVSIAGVQDLDPLSKISENDPVLARWLSLVEHVSEEEGELIDSLLDAWGDDPTEGDHVPQ